MLEKILENYKPLYKPLVFGISGVALIAGLYGCGGAGYSGSSSSSTTSTYNDRGGREPADKGGHKECFRK
jgi:hypothetical protein